MPKPVNRNSPRSAPECEAAITVGSLLGALINPVPSLRRRGSDVSPSDRKANAVFGLYVLAIGLIAAPLVHQSFGHAGHSSRLSQPAQALRTRSTAHDERVPHQHPARSEDRRGEESSAAAHGVGGAPHAHRDDHGGHEPQSSNDHGGAPHKHRDDRGGHAPQSSDDHGGAPHAHRDDRGGHEPQSSDDHGGAPHEHREGSTEHPNFVVAELALEALTLMALTVDARLLLAGERDGEAREHLLIAEPQGP